MQLQQLKDATGQAYNDLKTTNDAQNASSDVLNVDKLSKIQERLDFLTSQFELLKKQPTRSTISGVVNTPSLQTETKASFADYIRSNDFVSSSDFGSPSTDQINNDIKAYLMENSVIRKFAKNILISRDSLEYVKNKDNVTAEWSDGTTAPSSIEGYQKINIKVNDLIAQPKVTHKLLDDVEMNFDSWLASELGQIFLQQENEAFINGDGVNKPKGILSYTSGTNAIESVNSKNATGINVDGLINLIYSLDDVYANGAVMMMNKSTVQEIRKLKDANGQYLWMPGILSGKSDTIMGVPLQTVSNIPSMAANAFCAIYGNFEKGYVIADHKDIVIQKDPFSAKPFISFYCTKRVGGDVINTKAMKVLKIAA